MKKPSELQKAKKHKSKNSDEDDEEPQDEPGTFSNSQPTVPLLPLHQGPAAKSQRPAALDNSVDEDSEFCDFFFKKEQKVFDSEGTLFYPDLHVLKSDEHWTETPETHVCSSSRSFCFVTTEN